MSTIVILTPPAHGHINPILPVVRALAERGNRMVCCNTPEFRAQFEQAGAIFRPYPPSDMSASVIARLLQSGNHATMTRLILRATEQLLPALIDVLAREPPDLVIFDSIALWGKIAAAHRRLRAAASIGLFVLDERHAALPDQLQMAGQALPNLPGILSARRRLIRRYGAAYPLARPLFPMRDGLNIVYTARELQPDTPIIDETFRFVGPSIDRRRPGACDLPGIGGPGPLVYISLGTIHAGHTAFFRVCFEAFADHPARFILSAGERTRLDALGPIPANFVARPTVPQLDVLQHADAFITHAGMNSVHEGLYCGVPLLLIPHQFEQLLNARCVAARGAGHILDAYIRGRPLTPAALRQSLDHVLAKARYREAARELQRTLRATGGYQQAAEAITAYLAAG
jgi:MGT family glycosyltransferase